MIKLIILFIIVIIIIIVIFFLFINFFFGGGSFLAPIPVNQQFTLCTTLTDKALSRYVLKKPAEFLGLWIYPWKFQIKQSFTPAKYRSSSWKFQDQKPRPMEIPWFLFFISFFDNPGNSTSFLCLNGPWNFHMLFLQQYPENSTIMSSTPSSIWIFSRITHCQHILTISNAFQNNSKMFIMYNCLI